VIEPLGVLASLAILLLPGAALVRREEWGRGDPIEIVAVCLALSAAFWAVAFWALKFFPVSFRLFGLLVLGAALAALAARRRILGLAVAAWRGAPRAAMLAAAFVAGTLALRLAFAGTHLGFSGGDMTEHAALAEMVVLSDGFPHSQEPLAPISRYGQFPPGFHAVSALTTLLSGTPTYRSTILVLCVALAALTFSLYALLSGFGIARWPAAAGAAGALLLARNPQFFAQWGGAPMLLSLAVVFLLLRDARRLVQRSDPSFVARAGLLAAGTALIHPLSAVSFVYVFAAVAAVAVVSGRGRWRDLASNAVAAAAVAVALATPFLAAAPRVTSPKIALWAHGWFRQEMQPAVFLERRFFPGSPRQAGLATWPFFLIVYLGVLPTALLAAGLAKRWWKERGEATSAATAVVAACLLLFAGGLFEFLPPWTALYPSRTSAWLAVPLAVALSSLAAPIARLTRVAALLVAADLTAAFLYEGWQLRGLEFGTAYYEAAKAGRASILSIAAHEMGAGAYWIALRSKDNSAVTSDDLGAFAWIREHTPREAVFANNPGDGGGLLPAAAHRKIFDPHFYWFFDEAEMSAWRARARLDFVYAGARPSPAWPARFQAGRLETDPAVEEVFRSGKARVFRIRDPFDPRFR
jgi:hypothetical protein